MSDRSESSWDDLRRRHADAPEGEDGYGQLARLEVPPRLAGLWPGLDGFGLETMPHEAKALRKQIGRVRDFLDVFVFAYDPEPSPVPGVFDDDDDRWRVVREDLDRGYELMGSFKDLYDLQGIDDPAQAEYDPHEMASRRYGVLAWTTLVSAPLRRAAYSSYVGAPSLHRTYDRPDRHQPRFFWREADLEPKKRLGGLANIARLQRALIKAARADLEAMAELDELHEPKRQEPFHDFRKRLRTVEKLAVYFPEIKRPREGAAERLQQVIDTVDRYGEINDRLVAHARAVERGRDEKAAKLEGTIATDWKALKKWQRKNDLDEVLGDLRKDVHKP